MLDFISPQIYYDCIICKAILPTQCPVFWVHGSDYSSMFWQDKGGVASNQYSNIRVNLGFRDSWIRRDGLYLLWFLSGVFFIIPLYDNLLPFSSSALTSLVIPDIGHRAKTHRYSCFNSSFLSNIPLCEVKVVNGEINRVRMLLQFSLTLITRLVFAWISCTITSLKVPGSCWTISLAL